MFDLQKYTLTSPMKTSLNRFIPHHLYSVTLIMWIGLAVSGVSQIITWQEDWELPVAQDNWFSDNGYWEIGVPIYGPPTNSMGWRAHQGTNCAATVLNGDYTDDRESRLISSPILIPAASNFPRLRFWHWWSFGACDYGQVQISTNNGVSWLALSPGYYLDSSGRWTRGWLDLTSYAGRTVRLALFFHANSGFGCGGVGPGWYVDEMVIESGLLPVVISPDSFEGVTASDRWNADFGVWEIGVPTGGPPTNSLGGRAHQGTNVAATILEGTYTDDRESRLSSQPFVVPTVNPRLRFWHWWSFGPCDYGQVQISTNNGVSWIGLSPGYGADSSGGWTRAWLDLTAYAGQAVRLGLFFHANSGFGCGGVGFGWYVDEIVIEAGPLPVMISPDSFEDVAASDRWNADFGVWEIGVPTNGPPTNSLGRRAHQGTNVAATILDGAYTDDRDSRLFSQPIVVPNVNPRLRFWHWWSFGPCDYGQVQISTNNGASWIGLSPGYGADSSGEWTRAWLDLTAYAGQTVQLGLFFHANSGFGCGGVGFGWYVDEIVIEAGPLASMITPDSFEDLAALDRWNADFGVWEIGAPTSGPGAAHAGSNCLATILSGNYFDDRESRVSSQPFVVPPAKTNPRFRFWHWRSFGPCDYGQVQISTNNGSGWITLATYDATTTWAQPQFDLIPYAGRTVRLGFLFHANSGFGCGGVGPGWYVDEVRLVHDFGLVLLNSPVVRTQDNDCISLGIAANSSVSNLSFVLEASPGRLNNLTLNTVGCWSGALSQQTGSEWLVSLQNSCTTTPMGVSTNVSICFTAISTGSAFVPLAVTSLSVTNQDGSQPPIHAFGNRAVIIGNEALLESWLNPNRQRMLTLFGKANTTYQIYQATNITEARPWPLAWTTPSVPASLFISSPVQGAFSNAPVLFLDAREN